MDVVLCVDLHFVLVLFAPGDQRALTGCRVNSQTRRGCRVPPLREAVVRLDSKDCVCMFTARVQLRLCWLLLELDQMVHKAS